MIFEEEEERKKDATRIYSSQIVVCHRAQSRPKKQWAYFFSSLVIVRNFFR
jgi:hypothetical protein